MTTLIVIVIVTVILIIALISLGKSNEDINKEHHEHIENLAEQIATHQDSQTSLEQVKKERSLDDFKYSFELKGLYYRDQYEKEKANELRIGDELKLMHETTNRKDKYAVMVLTDDLDHIGYVPADMSEMLCRNLKSLEKCTVELIFHDKIPDIWVEITMKEKTVFYWKKFLTSPDLSNEYKDKYPVLNTLVPSDDNIRQKRVDVWKELHEQHPEDNFIIYQYLEALYLNNNYDLFIEIGSEFREKLNLYGWELLDCYFNTAQEHQQRISESELNDQYASLYYEANDLLKEKKYQEALERFLRCMDTPYQVQGIPKNICKCYDKLGRKDDCLAFAKDALKRPWITVTTRHTLQKYIDKYSAS